MAPHWFKWCKSTNTPCSEEHSPEADHVTRWVGGRRGTSQISTTLPYSVQLQELPIVFFPPRAYHLAFTWQHFNSCFLITLNDISDKKQMSNSPGFPHSMLQGNKSLLNHTVYLPEHRFYSLTKYLSHPQKYQMKKKVSDNLLLKLSPQK